MNTPWRAGDNLIDFAHIAFLGLAGVIFAVASASDHSLALTALLHFALVLLLIWLNRGAGDRPRLQLLHKLYPVLLLPYMYGELGPLNRLVSGRFYDSTVQGWETGLFGQSPALWLSQSIPWLAFSELLHITYLTYYFLFPVLGYYLVQRGRYRDFQIACWTCLTTMILNLGFTIFFPVKGPRPLFPELALSLQGPVWHFAHTYVLSHAADGAAFPSSHCSLSVVTALTTWRYARPIAIPMTIVASLIVIATVYCRFHYAVDAIGGITLAMVCAWLGPWTFNKLRPLVQAPQA